MFWPTVPGEPLTVGWLFHHCLQVYYERLYAAQMVSNDAASSDTFLWDGSNDGMAAAYEPLDLLDSTDGWRDTSETVRRVLDGYFEEYHRRDRWKMIAIEETLFYKGHFPYSARLDLIVEDMDRGGMWIVEHKTARAITAELLDNYQLDMQILGQVWLLNACVDISKYPDFRGVKINIATKHKTPQFTRIDVCPSREHLDAFVRAIQHWSVVRHQMAQLDWPQALGHCSGYARGYSRCQFFELCHGHPAMSVDDWATTEAPYGFEKESAA